MHALVIKPGPGQRPIAARELSRAGFWISTALEGAEECNEEAKARKPEALDRAGENRPDRTDPPGTKP